jgi:hypothetical protein
MLAMSIAFTLLFLAISRDARLVHVPLDRATVRRTLRRFSVGGVFYLATIGLSFVSAVLTLIVHALLALYYCFDQLASARS